MKKILYLVFSFAALLLSAATVKLSDFKPEKNDAGTALQSAINSGAGTVIVDNPGYPLILHRQIYLRSDLTLIFEDGVRVVAAEGRFRSLGEFLFRANGLRNITMLGKGKVVLQMRKSDYQDPKRYQPSEYRHMIGMYGVSNVRIANLELRESGGDGIYLGTTKDQKYCKNVILEDLIIDSHHRQGISVISAEDLIIRRCRILNTSGTAPAAGIDFEPNSTPAPQRLVNCLIENCVISGNQGAGIEFYTVYLEGDAPAQSITVRNCVISDNREGMTVFNSFYRTKRENVTPPRGFVKFEKCRFENNKYAELLIRDNLDTVALSFTDCSIKSGKDSIPIILAIEGMTGGKIGNINFGNLQINSDSKEVIAFKSWTDAQISTIVGNITLITSSGKKNFDLNNRMQEISAEIANRNRQYFVPAIANPKKFAVKTPDDQSGFKGKILLRGMYTVILCGSGTLTADYVVVRRDIQLKFSDMTGVNCFDGTLSKKVKHLQQAVSPGGNAYAAISASGGEIRLDYTGAFGYSGSKLLLTECHARFAVLKNADEFEFKIAGKLRRPVSYLIMDESGKVVASGSVEEPRVVKIKHTPGVRSTYTISMDIADTAEFTLGKGTEGVLSAGKLPQYLDSAR